MPVCRLLYRQLGRQFDSPDTVSLLARLTNWFTLKARAAQTESLNAWRENATLFSVEVNSSESCIIF